MAVRPAGGAKLLHILDGETGLMYLPEITHALSFKEEYAIDPEVMATLPPALQAKIKGMGARMKPWTERDRQAYLDRQRPEPEAPKRRGRPPKSEAEAEATV